MYLFDGYGSGCEVVFECEVCCDSCCCSEVHAYGFHAVGSVCDVCCADGCWCEEVVEVCGDHDVVWDLVPGCVLGEVELSFSHVCCFWVGFGSYCVAVHCVVADADAVWADDFSGVEDVCFVHLCCGVESSCFSDVEECGPSVAVSVVVFAEADVFHSVFCLDVVEVSECVFFELLFEGSSLLVCALWVSVVGALQVSSFGVLVDFVFVVWEDAAAGCPAVVPFWCVVVFCGVVVFGFWYCFVCIFTEVFDDHEVAVGLESVVSLSCASWEECVCGSVVVDDSCVWFSGCSGFSSDCVFCVGCCCDVSAFGGVDDELWCDGDFVSGLCVLGGDLCDGAVL